MNDMCLGRARYAAVRLYELRAALAKLAASLLPKINRIKMAPAGLSPDEPVDMSVIEAAGEESAAIRDNPDHRSSHDYYHSSSRGDGNLLG